jgi:ABC-2 type transport system permease protein
VAQIHMGQPPAPVATIAWRKLSLKYASIMFINFQNQLAYIWDVMGRAFFIVIILYIFVQLWSMVYASQGTHAIAGLTLSATIWYFLAAEMIELGKFRHDVRISAEVKDGSIAYALTRPYNYLVYHFFNGLGESVVRMALIFAFGLPIALIYGGAPQIQWDTLPLVLVVFVLALVLDFIMASSIGLLAFVTEDTASFRLIYQKTIFILGGLLLPIDFLPDWLQGPARILPFSQVTYAPAKLLVAFDMAQCLHVLALQCFWIAVLGFGLRLQYGWAVRRLAVNGG